MKTIGHRGARGYFPENTLEGYRRTIALGVDGIELDVVCSGDRQLITSHNPFPDPDFSSVTDDLNFFALDYKHFKHIDVGQKQNPKFKKQTTYKATIPTLLESITLINDLVSEDFVLFVEVKHKKSSFYPFPDEYAALVFEELENINFKGTLIVKSFSLDFMNAFYQISKGKYLLGYLTEIVDGINKQIDQLIFKPFCVNIRHDLIDANLIKKLNGYEIYPWSVNTVSELKRLSTLELSGIITDYPLDLLDE